MKILILTHAFVRHDGDLAGVFLLDIAREFVNKRMKVVVIAPHEGKLPVFERLGGIDIYRFKYAPPNLERLAYKGNMHELVILSLLNKIIFLFFMFFFLFRTLSVTIKEKVDLIHAHWWIPSGIIAFFTSIFLRKPYVVTTHGTDTYIIEKYKILKPLAKVVYGRAYFITAVASLAKSILMNSLKISSSKIETFPMPADISILYPKYIKKEKKNVILSIGRLVERKGFNYLIEALYLLKKKGKKLKLIIIGEGPDKRFLTEKIQALKLYNEIKILSHRPKSELNYFYNQCDVFVLPSITTWTREQEGLSVAVLEALSCKKPVITTPTGGMEDVIKDGITGLIVPEKDAVALVRAIERVLDDDNFAEKISSAGYKEVIENYTPLKVAERMLNIYSKVLYKSTIIT